MFIDKYYPKSTKDLFNRASVDEVKRFLVGWKKGKALLLHGPTGSGKSVSVKLVAKELGYDLIENHADGERGVKNFLSTSMESGVFSKKKIVMFEDIETMRLRGFSDLIKNSVHPIICTVGDVYSVSAPIRKLFKPVKFEKAGEQEIIMFVDNLCKAEKINMQRRDMEQLAKTCNGDVRSLLIDIELFRLGLKHNGYRDVEDNVFSTLRVIFKSMSIENSRIAIKNSEKGVEDLFRWIESNITEEYSDIETIAMALDYLSKADIFRSRIIRRQSWNLEKYFIDLSVYGTSLAKKKPSVRFTSYRPPVYFARSDVALEKLAKALHISKRQAVVYIPIIRMLAKRNSRICEEIGMENDEIRMVLG